jgi:tetratricopeptide (TPR) repeat protein
MTYRKKNTSFYPILILFTLLNSLFTPLNTISQEVNEYNEISEIEETGDYLKALSQAKKLLATDSLNEKLWIETAKLYRLNQQYRQAINAYQKAFKINPENKLLILYLAKTNKLTGNKDLSVRYYREFLQSEPDNVMALSELAFIYSSGNLADSATSIYKKLVELDTFNVAYHHKLANSQWFTGNQEEAFLNYKKAYQLDSTYLPLVYDLARIYINKKFQDSAISMLEMNIIYSPQESRLHYDLGNANFSKGDYFSAIPAYEKAIELGFKAVEVYRKLAISYYTTSQFDKSKQLFESLIQKDTSDYKICMYLGNIYNLEMNSQKGLLFFNKAIKLLTPDSMVVTAIYNGISVSYKIEGNYPELINSIKRRQENTPVSYLTPQYLLEIAEIYERNLNDKSNALKYYQQFYHAIEKSEYYDPEVKSKIKVKINKLKAE